MPTIKLSTLRRLQIDSLNESYESVVGKFFPDSNFVPGTGSMKPKYMFIGEAPGENEDKQLQPFVGNSGKLLDLWLGWGSIRRKVDAYITNVVKFRPVDDEGNNRPPSETEVNASTYYLRREIFILKPDVVVTLGAFATKVFHPLATMSVVVGRARQRNVNGHTCTFVPMYHPSHILRNPDLADDCYDHVNAVLHAYNVQVGNTTDTEPPKRTKKPPKPQVKRFKK